MAQPASGIPGVHYCRDIAEIHDVLIELGAEGHHRIRLAVQLGDDVRAAEPERVGPRQAISTSRAPQGGDPPEVGGAARPEEAESIGSEVGLVGLRAAQQELEGMTLAGLRWARRNDPDFPTPAGRSGAEHLYRLDDLRQWVRNRPRTRERRACSPVRQAVDRWSAAARPYATLHVHVYADTGSTERAMTTD
ncbi:hypothetical protein [Streptomyces gardneri]|uniref:hypothetical protein n=1 Tax=Streptomyces gardneri TaxID=66892 RepID=UPI0035DFF3E5